MNFERKRKIPKPPSEILLGDLEISTRLYQFLKLNGCETLADIVTKDIVEFESFNGFNKSFLKELQIIIENNRQEQPEHDRWAKAIMAERNFAHSPSLERSITYVEKYDKALILGDACQVNSKYLGEVVGFTEIDNVDASPMVLDGYYDSPKMHPFHMYFAKFHYPENTYNLIYGKSLSFIGKEFLAETLIKIEKSLQKGGVFTAIWRLPESTAGPQSYGIWEKEEILKALEKINLKMVYTDEQINNEGNLLGEPAVSHLLEVIMKKE